MEELYTIAVFLVGFDTLNIRSPFKNISRKARSGISRSSSILFTRANKRERTRESKKDRDLERFRVSASLFTCAACFKNKEEEEEV